LFLVYKPIGAEPQTLISYTGLGDGGENNDNAGRVSAFHLFQYFNAMKIRQFEIEDNGIRPRDFEQGIAFGGVGSCKDAADSRVPVEELAENTPDDERVVHQENGELGLAHGAPPGRAELV
jgi:hypothetical protein